ncbi:apolipoprotein N-acyltransferase [Candidatus Steffania adelgidicola]|uniref:apolipoprotein N-acyltransferase n=1 Tax=Candidatus Steffania adelgidicola TaxID=1076626 RepID=UPI001D00F55D|nr:apolipoprotein N-acyltransferase [Candidatus Steffania adelgidicola]UDG80079.1 Apolipoprotein N-acyltransferase [Candidatus Steffania adelgidicola]
MVIPSVFSQQWLRTLLALLTGTCGTLAFSPYDFWPAAIISLVGLLMVITFHCSSREAAWLGFLWGFSLFGTGINWIYVSIVKFSDLPHLVNIGLIALLVTYLALYPMLFSTILVKLWPHSNLCRLVLGAPTVWLITDFLRGWVFTGFPWLEFGYSQIDGPLKGIAPIFGVQAITFVLVIVSGLTATAMIEQKWYLALSALALLLFPWPLSFLHWYQLQPERALNVALVQGNIPQLIKWQPRQLELILNIYLQRTLPTFGKAQIVIWPETAIPDDEISQNVFLTQFDKQLRAQHTRLISGIIDIRPTSHHYDAYNSILVLGEETPYFYPSKNRYQKYHLVPFGETIPLENLLRPLSSLFNLPMSSLSHGEYLQPQLQVAGMKLTAAVCYEIILGMQVRDNFHPNTDFLLTLSNDAWFGDSIGPWQHFQMARMRALELGRPLLRSTNNGITAVINANGIPQAQLPQFTRDVLIARVSPTKGITPYTRAGYWPLWIFGTLLGLTALVIDKRYLTSSTRSMYPNK